jgi:hypothetical protein
MRFGSGLDGLCPLFSEALPPPLPATILSHITGLRGRCITLKVKRRQEGAPEPAKFLGHGWCDNLSRSITLAGSADSAEEVGHALLS